MKKILVSAFAAPLLFLLAVSTSIAMSGCSALFSNLPAVNAAISDGILVLDSIQAFTNAYFAANPNPDKATIVAIAIAKARTALDVAVRLVQGTSSLDQAQVDTAFADFRVAYTELTGLIGSIGVKTSGSRLQAIPGGLNVPAPLALTLKL